MSCRIGEIWCERWHRRAVNLEHTSSGRTSLRWRPPARLVRAGGWTGPGGMLHIAIAPLDIALWDAAGKAVGQPLYRLLGGCRDRMPAYASDRLWYSLSLDELAESASQHVRDGYRTVKLRLGKEARPEGEVERVRTVRQAVGADVQILVDATESWDRPGRYGPGVSCRRLASLGWKIHSIVRISTGCLTWRRPWRFLLPVGNICMICTPFKNCCSTARWTSPSSIWREPVASPHGGALRPWPRPITCRCVATSSRKSMSTCCRLFPMRSWSRCAALGGNFAGDAGTGGWMSGGSENSWARTHFGRGGGDPLPRRLKDEPADDYSTRTLRTTCLPMLPLLTRPRRVLDPVEKRRRVC